MRLTLIRHGPTHWNASRRFQGRSDLPLSPLGRGHARAIAQALQGETIDRIYSSDLVRALETAQILAAARGTSVETDERLREFDFGQWEGLTWSEIVAQSPHLAGRGSTAATLYAPPDGESFAQVCERVRSFLDDLACARLDSAAVVTHAGALHATLEILGLGESAKRADNLSLRFTPGGITRIALEAGRAQLLSLDNLRHLDAAG